ncbi:aspartate-semialdehyde dehydrogenase [Roseibium hamelinense]|uniref:Aspartate-semialdehyde dehydrogenase n=1 Tax=Roseibium hamelinense TaxID=150831 RepID=A0A562TGG6_9HYPH|nr:aspartate-semialdehyde dehydrogenase [Roseibium hamelinense]MTI46146.1 aspartate-semialdehyde dehydrogenase [Roseibium hamelinense]TWI92661.1 aspartate-semialdehyde dehydrogenase [Roseibium hamelinense]
MNTNHPNIAIVGATGAVGQTLISLLDERDFPVNDVALLASSRSAGRKQVVRGKERQVEDLEGFNFANTDLAFFSAGGSVSERHARRAAAQGALVIDNTNAFRMDDDVPLVVPQVNAEVVRQRPDSGIISNPNCSTIPLVRLLRPLHDHTPISSVVVSTYQAASGAGLSGIDELRKSADRVLSDQTSADTDNVKFSDPLGFNLIPNIDRPLDTGFTLEEQKMLQESRKIMGLPDFALTATCVRVPVINAHSETAYIRFETPVGREQVVSLLRSLEDILVYDDGPGKVTYPTPRFLSDPNQVHVGRIRINPDDPCGLWLWLIADNIRIGAALNAIQIAEAVTNMQVQ